MTLTNHLIDARKQAGLSQGEVAEALEVSRQAVSRWETGLALPSTDNLAKLSKLYGISIDALLGGQTTPPPTDEAAKTSIREDTPISAEDDVLYADTESPAASKEGHITHTRKAILTLGILCAILAVAAAVLLYLLHEERKPLDFDEVNFEHLDEEEFDGSIPLGW